MLSTLETLAFISKLAIERYKTSTQLRADDARQFKRIAQLANEAIANAGWHLITDNPPLDRAFLGASVGRVYPEGSVMAGQKKPDHIFHISSRHMDYMGGPAKWTWNSEGGMYGIYLTHWRELPELPKP